MRISRGAPLDPDVFQRPERDLTQVPLSSHARIEVTQLEPVQKDANPARISEERRHHGLRDPPSPQRSHPGHALQKLGDRERAGRKEASAIPHEASARISQHRSFSGCNGALDRVLHRGRDERARRIPLQQAIAPQQRILASRHPAPARRRSCRVVPSCRDERAPYRASLGWCPAAAPRPSRTCKTAPTIRPRPTRPMN